ncbi:MAG: asparagine synthase-related protein [Anaerolineaceae bacterium]
MAGLALFIDQHGSQSTLVFNDFLKQVAAYKSLEMPILWAQGSNCTAARLDSPCSLHKDIARDAMTGSWLLAAGTVIDNPETSPNGSLDKILIDYLNQGVKVFSRLDGQFAIILYDARSEKILVLSDPFGLIPVYYSQIGSKFFLSTSSLAVAKVSQSPLSEFGARSFVVYGDTFGDTIWQNVHILPPATVLEIGREGTCQSTYWSFQVDPSIMVLHEKESVDCIIETLSSSLRRSLSSEGKVWISLTGGMDSRMLAGLAQYCHIPFKTYCHGPKDSKDVRISEQISHEMGWEYEYFALPEDWGNQRINWFYQVLGQTDGHLDVIKMSRTIREQSIKARQLGTSLWGYGGELYRGVYWKHEFWRRGRTSQVNYDRLMDFRVIPSDCSVLGEGAHWKEALRSEIKSRFLRIGEQQPDWPNTVKLDMIGTALERHICGTTIAAVLGQQRVILPFDFKENITRIFSTNYKWRTHGRMFRLILEKINPQLAKMETADGGPALPMRISNFYRFLPYWLDSGDKLLWRLGYKVKGKPLWKQRVAGQSGHAYPSSQWLQDTLTEVGQLSLLSQDQMLSAALYDQKWLKGLESSPQVASRVGEAVIGRVLALEMALRSIRNIN